MFNSSNLPTLKNVKGNQRIVLGCSKSIASAAPPSPKSCSFRAQAIVFVRNHEENADVAGGGGSIFIYAYPPPPRHAKMHILPIYP